MPGATNMEGTIVPARHNIGSTTLNEEHTTLPYVTNSCLPNTSTKSTPRNPSFNKTKRNIKHKNTPRHADNEVNFQKGLHKNNVTADNNNNNNDKSKISLLELSITIPNETHSPSVKSDNGVNYVQNYKTAMKQRGVKYQELFGHTPRKPDQRLGHPTHKPPPLVVPLSQSQLSQVNSISRQRNNQESPTMFHHTRLPGIVTEADLAANVKARHSKTGSDNVHNGSKCPSEQEINAFDISTLSFGQTEEDELMSERLSEVFNEYQSSGLTVRRQRKRGKLGDIITPRKMEELLETNEPLRMENYFNLYE